ncbi:MAG: hypothetical protein STHCBS139747_006894 [Sporothrix thermara]
MGTTVARSMSTSTSSPSMPHHEDCPDAEPPLSADNERADILGRAACAIGLASQGINTVAVPIGPGLASHLVKPFKTEAVQDLGSLSRLPPELVLAVCRELDVRSCLTLRQVNRCARQTVSSLLEYCAVTTHAPNVLQAVLWSGMGQRVTMPDLYRLLYAHECMVCSLPENADPQRYYDSRAPKNRPKVAPGVQSAGGGRVGPIQAASYGANDKGGGDVDEDAERDMVLASKKRPTALTALAMDWDTAGDGAAGKAAGLYVFLPTLTRCCKPCLEESPRLRVVPLLSLRSAADIPRRHFLPYACMPWLVERSASGKRRKNKRTAKGSGNSRGEAIQERLLKHLDEATVTQGDAARLLFDAGFTTTRVQQVLYESGYLNEFSWWGEVEKRIDFTVSMPFLDRRTRTAGCGYTCRGCDAAIQKLYGSLQVELEYTNTVYSTEAAFMEHFAACPEAIKLWKDGKI